jgi:HPr kinase/phosphorylase
MNARRQFSVAQLYEDHRDKLKLSWVIAVGVDRAIELKEQGYFGADVVGHLNLIHPERLQVIGRAEQAWGYRVTAGSSALAGEGTDGRQAPGADYR